MTGMRPLACLQRESEGGALVEFAFLLPVMLALLIGGMDLAHQSYVRTVLQGALNNTARTAAVENPQFAADGDTIAEQVEAAIRDRMAPIAPGAIVEVTQESFFDFTNIGNPEKLMQDDNENGQYDEDDGDCFEDVNRNGRYDTDTGVQGRGNANDVVFYRAELSMDRLFPSHVFLPIASRTSMVLETAVRNQPYGERPTPPVVCGDEEEDD